MNMKTIFSTAIVLFLIIFMVGAQTSFITLTGNVTDIATGAPIPNHAVNAEVMSGGMVQNFTYLTTTYGYYGDSISVFGDGTLNVSTFDCNGELHSYSGTFGPNNYSFVFDFDICGDSIPSGCQAWFGYEIMSNGVVAFFDQSTGNPATGNPDHWLWDFGDSTTSSEQNPIHAYNGFGNFNVCLTIWDDEGFCQDTYCDMVYINGSGGDCQNWFTYQASNNFDFSFMGQSSPPASQYFWSFGDGESGYGQNVTHTYGGNPGQTYLVTLTTLAQDTMIGDSCMATSVQEIWLNGSGNGCENWFWYEQDSISGFNFHGESFPNPAYYYAWDFGDGQTGYGQEVSHNYGPNTGNVFMVTLTTYSYSPDGDSCTAVSNQEVWMNGQGNGCENWFWYTNPVPGEFVFQGESFPIPASEYIWDFGDGSTATGQTVNHTYEPGSGEVFMVTLTTLIYDPVVNDSCVAVSTQEVWVNGQTGDCENWFWYESISTFEYSFHGQSAPFPAEQYIWQFDNGMVLLGQDITYTFDPSSGNEHLVCLTTYSYSPNADSCSYTSCQGIILGGQTGVELFGAIYTTDSVPADFALVGLFGMKPDGSFSYNFTVTEQGMYFFSNVQPGDYYIFASLTPQSQLFYDYFPTYYGDAITWSGATLITLGEPQNPYNIHLVPVEGTISGPGMINGSITMGDGKGDPGTNITVMLMDEDENTLAFTESDDDGLFSFENLAYGTYKLKVEIPGKPSAIATVVLQESNPEGELVFIVKYTEVTLNTGKIPGFAKFVGEIFPNPVADKANLEISMIKPANLMLRVMNQLGQEVQSTRLSLSEGDQLINIKTSGFRSGFYTLQIIDNEGGMLVKKFIK
jgi:PKD repeat protein